MQGHGGRLDSNTVSASHSPRKANETKKEAVHEVQ